MNKESFMGDVGRVIGIGVIDRLTAFELPVTPAHYEVIFAYQVGTHPDLVREIDAILGRASASPTP
ncbi:MAG: hypothetical protein HC850_16140 [Rhodomicrobium sp.]|nr:hypothetical protein [Rhodomicrobium sp.]